MAVEHGQFLWFPAGASTGIIPDDDEIRGIPIQSNHYFWTCFDEMSSRFRRGAASRGSGAFNDYLGSVGTETRCMASEHDEVDDRGDVFEHGSDHSLQEQRLVALRLASSRTLHAPWVDVPTPRR